MQCTALHHRVHLCANRGYPVEAINRAIADALEAGELRKVEDGYVVVHTRDATKGSVAVLNPQRYRHVPTFSIWRELCGSGQN